MSYSTKVEYLGKLWDCAMKTFILVVAMKFISSLEMIMPMVLELSLIVPHFMFPKNVTLYSDYLIDEYSEDFDSDYVFVYLGRS